jgi:hypothetical protein
MRYVAGLLLLSVVLFAAQIVKAETNRQPILALIEYHGWGGIGYPLPNGLALVAYEDGLIIQSDRGSVSVQSAFISSQRTPAEVAALAAEAKSALQGVDSHEQQPNGLPTDQGWTIILYRDPATAELVELTTYGLPCLAADAEQKGPFTADLRNAADPRFLRFCDGLVRKTFSNAEPWFPKEMLVFLRAQPARPDKVIDWPSDWPKAWQESADHTSRTICVPISNQPSGVTKEMLFPPPGRVPTTAVEETKIAWWVIAGLEVSMPGELSLDDAGRRVPLLNGPCSGASSPG